MKMSEAPFGPLPGVVTLDGTGMGALRFAPTNSEWDISNVSVQVSTNTNEATATIYIGQIGSMYRHSGTYAGSSGDNNTLETPIHLTDGKAMYIVWEGGDPGAVATATISGTQTVNTGGFRVQ